MAADLEAVFREVSGLLRKHAKGKGMEVVDHLESSTAKVKKPSLILRGKKVVEIFNRPAQKTYVAGAMLHGTYVGFYFMPIYAAPEKFKLSAAMKKRLKGKSCFYLKAWDGEVQKDVDALLKQGVGCFRELGWV